MLAAGDIKQLSTVKLVVAYSIFNCDFLFKENKTMTSSFSCHDSACDEGHF